MKLFSFITVTALSLFAGKENITNTLHPGIPVSILSELPKTDVALMNLKGKVESVATNICTTKLVEGKPAKDQSTGQNTTLFNKDGFITAAYNYDGNAALVAITESKYDAQSRLIEQTYFDGKSVYLGSIILTYNSKGYKIADTDSRPLSYKKNVYGYDEKGNKNYEANYTRSDTDQYYFVYNPLNQLIEKTHYNLAKNVKYYRESYKYDQKGNMVEELYEYFGLKSISKRIYTYDSKGRGNGYSVYAETGELKYRTTKSYDQYDNPTASYSYNKDGSIDSKELRTYTYDSQGNWLTQFCEIGGDTYFLERLITYY